MKYERFIVISVLLGLQSFAQTAPAPASYLKQATISQIGQKIHVTANSPRPLAQILDALHEKYGWVVNYEDPQYTSHADSVEVADGTTHSQVPSGGNFEVEFAAESTPDEEKTLHLVVDAYNHSRNPGQFELRHDAQSNFDIVGMAAHDEKGTIAEQQVLLDRPVTLPSEERTIVDTINAIFQTIALQSHTAATLGVYPRSLLGHTPVKVGGTKITARELLRQSLQGSHRKFYWRLLFDPASRGYFLDLHVVRPA